jgi:hypothetical protein
MIKSRKSKINCIITGKVETYEMTEIETPPSGRGGHTDKILLKKASCLNYKCSYRDKSDCPLWELNK